MRVKYHTVEGLVFEIDAPEGTELDYQSHRQCPPGRWLDDILVVPWNDKRIGLQGEVVPRAAEQGILGLRVLRVTRRAGTPCRTHPT